MTTVRLHPTQVDAVSGINTIVLTSFGSGVQFLKAHKDKSVLESITVINGGENYENKKRNVFPVGINTALNTVNSVNHDFESGEIVKYTCKGTPVSGLTTDTEYYVTKVDDNNFKLSTVGVATEKDIFYRTNRHVNLTSVGVGTHFFNYPDINVSLVGKVGLASTGNTSFEASIQPIFRGQVTSVDLTANGVGYGVSEVINLERLPVVTLGVGSDAQLKPIIKNGAIDEVIVDNQGSGYVSLPDLIIDGDGVGAVLTPVTKTVGSGSTETKVIDYIKVVSGGQNYTQDETTVTVSPAGSGAQFLPILQEWRINLVERFFNTNKMTSDEGARENYCS